MLKETIKQLTIKTHEKNAPIWKDLAKRLSRSACRRAEVNISRIARHTKDGDVVAVPGKILGAGAIEHHITVGAFAFSEQAQKKITSAGGKCLTLNELVEKNPKGTNIKILE